MPIRLMIDSDNLDVIASCDGLVPILATYSDLLPHPQTWTDQHMKRSSLVLIDRGLGDPSGQATIADLERGALTPAHYVAWHADKAKAKAPYLTAYVNRANIGALDQAVQGTPAASTYRIVATLDGTAHIAGFNPMHTPAGIQVLGAQQLGIHADLTMVLEDQWHAGADLGVRAAMSYLSHVRSDVSYALAQLSRYVG